MLNPVPKQKGRQDLRLVSVFIESILETFNTQCGIALTHGHPYRSAEQKGVSRDAITVFGLRTDIANVSIALMIPEVSYKVILVRMLKDPTAAATQAAIEDGLREIVNIVFNRANSRLNNQFHSILRTVPMLALGNNLKVWYLTVGEVITVPFSFETYSFEMEIVLEQN